MTRDAESLIYRIEGCLFTARLDAQTLKIGADRADYFTDVAQWNISNIEQLSVYVEELYKELTLEAREFGNIEDCPFVE